MSAPVWLVRHPPVARAWAGRCYGHSDPGLSREGSAMLASLAARLAALGPALVVHSGWQRTALPARRVAARAQCPLLEDPRWSERQFGAWEARPWSAIWRETGPAMDKMMTDPHGFRPGGGETSAEMAERAWAAFEALPPAPVVVISHGGPLAAVLARLAGAGLDGLVRHIPPPGAITRVERAPAARHSPGAAEKPARSIPVPAPP